MAQQATVVKLPPSESSTKYLGINIEKSRDNRLSDQAHKLVKDYYCKENRTCCHRRRHFSSKKNDHVTEQR